MPDLASATLSLTNCSNNVKPPLLHPSDPTNSISHSTSPTITLTNPHAPHRHFRFPVDLVKKPPCSATGSEDPLKDRSSLPFLLGAPEEVECSSCHCFLNPGEEILCSVRGCGTYYHRECAKEAGVVLNQKNFKCPRHVCFLCKQKLHLLRCVCCTMAFHHKCAPWPDEVVHLKDHPGQAVCWKHPSDWRLDRKPEASANDIKVVFHCTPPLPHISEEFKIDLTWKDMDTKMEPPPYVHIKRNIYLVKKKRSHADDGAGCTFCNSTCSDDCECRVQCISCSKACRCSENCNNRPFRKEKKIKIVKTELCGWGVEAAETIDKGGFIVEYIGEDDIDESNEWLMGRMDEDEDDAGSERVFADDDLTWDVVYQASGIGEPSTNTRRRTRKRKQVPTAADTSSRKKKGASRKGKEVVVVEEEEEEIPDNDLEDSEVEAEGYVSLSDDVEDENSGEEEEDNE